MERFVQEFMQRSLRSFTRNKFRMALVALLSIFMVGLAFMKSYAGEGDNTLPEKLLSMGTDYLKPSWGTPSVDKYGHVAESEKGSNVKICIGKDENGNELEWWIANRNEDSLTLYSTKPVESGVYNTYYKNLDSRGIYDSTKANNWVTSAVRAFLGRNQGEFPGDMESRTGEWDSTTGDDLSYFEKKYFTNRLSLKINPKNVITYDSDGNEFKSVDRFWIPAVIGRTADKIGTALTLSTSAKPEEEVTNGDVNLIPEKYLEGSSIWTRTSFGENMVYSKDGKLMESVVTESKGYNPAMELDIRGVKFISSVQGNKSDSDGKFKTVSPDGDGVYYLKYGYTGDAWVNVTENMETSSELKIPYYLKGNNAYLMAFLTKKDSGEVYYASKDIDINENGEGVLDLSNIPNGNYELKTWIETTEEGDRGLYTVSEIKTSAVRKGYKITFEESANIRFFDDEQQELTGKSVVVTDDKPFNYTANVDKNYNMSQLKTNLIKDGTDSGIAINPVKVSKGNINSGSSDEEIEPLVVGGGIITQGMDTVVYETTSAKNYWSYSISPLSSDISVSTTGATEKNKYKILLPSETTKVLSDLKIDGEKYVSSHEYTAEQKLSMEWKFVKGYDMSDIKFVPEDWIEKTTDANGIEKHVIKSNRRKPEQNTEQDNSVKNYYEDLDSINYGVTEDVCQVSLQFPDLNSNVYLFVDGVALKQYQVSFTGSVLGTDSDNLFDAGKLYLLEDNNEIPISTAGIVKNYGEKLRIRYYLDDLYKGINGGLNLLYNGSNVGSASEKVDSNSNKYYYEWNNITINNDDVANYGKYELYIQNIAKRDNPSVTFKVKGENDQEFRQDASVDITPFDEENFGTYSYAHIGSPYKFTVKPKSGYQWSKVPTVDVGNTKYEAVVGKNSGGASVEDSVAEYLVTVLGKDGRGVNNAITITISGIEKIPEPDTNVKVELKDLTSNNLKFYYAEDSGISEIPEIEFNDNTSTIVADSTEFGPGDKISIDTSGTEVKEDEGGYNFTLGLTAKLPVSSITGTHNSKAVTFGAGDKIEISSDVGVTVPFKKDENNAPIVGDPSDGFQEIEIARGDASGAVTATVDNKSYDGTLYAWVGDPITVDAKFEFEKAGDKVTIKSVTFKNITIEDDGSLTLADIPLSNIRFTPNFKDQIETSDVAVTINNPTTSGGEVTFTGGSPITKPANGTYSPTITASVTQTNFTNIYVTATKTLYLANGRSVDASYTFKGTNDAGLSLNAPAQSVTQTFSNVAAGSKLDFNQDISLSDVQVTASGGTVNVDNGTEKVKMTISGDIYFKPTINVSGTLSVASTEKYKDSSNVEHTVTKNATSGKYEYTTTVTVPDEKVYDEGSEKKYKDDSNVVHTVTKNATSGKYEYTTTVTVPDNGTIYTDVSGTLSKTVGLTTDNSKTKLTYNKTRAIYKSGQEISELDFGPIDTTVDSNEVNYIWVDGPNGQELDMKKFSGAVKVEKDSELKNIFKISEVKESSTIVVMDKGDYLMTISYENGSLDKVVDNIKGIACKMGDQVDTNALNKIEDLNSPIAIAGSKNRYVMEINLKGEYSSNTTINKGGTVITKKNDGTFDIENIGGDVDIVIPKASKKTFEFKYPEPIDGLDITDASNPQKTETVSYGDSKSLIIRINSTGIYKDRYFPEDPNGVYDFLKLNNTVSATIKNVPDFIDGKLVGYTVVISDIRSNIDLKSDNITINPELLPKDKEFDVIFSYPDSVEFTCSPAGEILSNSTKLTVISGTDVTFTVKKKEGYDYEKISVIYDNDTPVQILEGDNKSEETITLQGIKSNRGILIMAEGVKRKECRITFEWDKDDNINNRNLEEAIKVEKGSSTDNSVSSGITVYYGDKVNFDIKPLRKYRTSKFTVKEDSTNNKLIYVDNKTIDGWYMLSCRSEEELKSSINIKISNLKLSSSEVRFDSENASIHDLYEKTVIEKPLEIEEEKSYEFGIKMTEKEKYDIDSVTVIRTGDDPNVYGTNIIEKIENNFTTDYDAAYTIKNLYGNVTIKVNLKLKVYNITFTEGDMGLGNNKFTVKSVIGEYAKKIDDKTISVAYGTPVQIVFEFDSKFDKFDGGKTGNENANGVGSITLGDYSNGDTLSNFVKNYYTNELQITGIFKGENTVNLNNFEVNSYEITFPEDNKGYTLHSYEDGSPGSQITGNTSQYVKHGDNYSFYIRPLGGGFDSGRSKVMIVSSDGKREEVSVKSGNMNDEYLLYETKSVYRDSEIEIEPIKQKFSVKHEGYNVSFYGLETDKNGEKLVPLEDDETKKSIKQVESGDSWTFYVRADEGYDLSKVIAKTNTGVIVKDEGTVTGIPLGDKNSNTVENKTDENSTSENNAGEDNAGENNTGESNTGENSAGNRSKTNDNESTKNYEYRKFRIDSIDMETTVIIENARLKEYRVQFAKDELLSLSEELKDLMTIDDDSGNRLAWDSNNKVLYGTVTHGSKFRFKYALDDVYNKSDVKFNISIPSIKELKELERLEENEDELSEYEKKRLEELRSLDLNEQRDVKKLSEITRDGEYWEIGKELIEKYGDENITFSVSNIKRNTYSVTFEGKGVHFDDVNGSQISNWNEDRQVQVPVEGNEQNIQHETGELVFGIRENIEDGYSIDDKLDVRSSNGSTAFYQELKQTNGKVRQYRLSNVTSDTVVTVSGAKSVFYTVDFKTDLNQDTDSAETPPVGLRVFDIDGRDISEGIRTTNGGSVRFSVVKNDEYTGAGLTVYQDWESEEKPGTEVSLEGNYYKVSNVKANSRVMIKGLKNNVNKYIVSFLPGNGDNSKVTFEYAKNNENDEDNRKVEHGKDYSFTVRPNTGYELEEAIVTATNCEVTQVYNNDKSLNVTLMNVTGNSTVIVNNVTLTLYDVKFNLYDGIDGNGNKLDDTVAKVYAYGSDRDITSGTQVYYKKDLKFRVQLSEGYSASEIKVQYKSGDKSGDLSEINGYYQIMDISDGVTVNIGNLKKNTYAVRLDLTATDANNVELSYSDASNTKVPIENGKLITGAVEYGGNFTFNIKAKDGYNLDKLSVTTKDAEVQILPEASENTPHTISANVNLSNIKGDLIVNIGGINKNTFLVSFPDIENVSVYDENMKDITVTGKEVAHDGSIKFTLEPHEGYDKNRGNWTVQYEESDGKESLREGTLNNLDESNKKNSYQLNNIKGNVNIYVTNVNINTYTVSFNKNTQNEEDVHVTFHNFANGNVIPGREVSVSHGGYYTFKVKPKTGYDLQKMGISADAGDLHEESRTDVEAVYTLSNITKDVNVNVNIDMSKVEVKLVPGTGIIYQDEGATSEITGRQTVTYGTDFSFTVRALEGYDITTLKVTLGDGSHQDQLKCTETTADYKKFTALKLETDYDISTSIEKKKYTITVPNIEGVSFYENDQNIKGGESVTARYGDSFKFRIVLDDKHNQSSVIVKANLKDENKQVISSKVLSAINGFYTITEIANDIDISVENVEINKYKINLVEGTGMQYNSGDGSQKDIKGIHVVTHGETFSFRISALEGYELSNMVVTVQEEDGSIASIKPSGGVYSITNIKGNKTVSVADAAMIQYKVTFAPADGVTYKNDTGNNISEPIMVTHGNNFEFSITIDDAYDDSVPSLETTSSKSQISKLSTGRYAISNITEDMTIKTLNVTKNRYAVTLKEITGIMYKSMDGKVLKGDQYVDHGGSFQFKVDLYPAYTDSSITAMLGKDEIKPEEDGSFLITGILENKTVTVTGVEENPEVRVINMINALRDSIRDASDVDAVVAATKAYDQLSDVAKSRVTNIDKLLGLQKESGTFIHTTNDITVEGVGWHIKLVAVPLSSSSDEMGRVYSKLSTEFVLSLYDIYLWDMIAEKKYTLPEGEKVNVSIPTPDLTYFKDTFIVHEKSLDGKLEYLTLNVDGGRTWFEMTSFSPVGMAAKRKVETTHSSFFDTIGANVDEMKRVLSNTFGAKKSSVSTSDDSSREKKNNQNGQTAFGDENIDEKFKKGNGALAQWSALRLLLVLVIGFIISIVITLLMRKKKSEPEDTNKFEIVEHVKLDSEDKDDREDKNDLSKE